ncbi:hypothetical protein SAMN05421863_11692 [Nitrosomonas communis]|uniref:Uncharacterized protein n=1 Tax=Nitrosomonas communis TaxID=44574 RepID=A0A1I4XQV3_9PROT|nr:hypothetical protein SAMN05421863_11692 [Nitrosomonas communis]
MGGVGPFAQTHARLRNSHRMPRTTNDNISELTSTMVRTRLNNCRLILQISMTLSQNELKLKQLDKKLSGKTLDAFCKCYFHHGDSNHIFSSAGQDFEILR